MMVVDVIFYAFAAVTALAAFGVVSSRNQVHSVLFLILTFFSTAALFVLLQAEFLAALLVMVYMGAVAVLFLFVVMMLDMELSELKEQAINHLPLGLAVGAVILLELVVVLSHSHGHAVAAATVPNTLAIGRALFTQHLYPFELASLILLVALIGAVVLTLRERKKGAQRQNVPQQIARTRSEAVELVQRKPGEGA
ncbi:MAG: NADH-quinone oxidoreductase subunit J [Magnetococcales bacterium]|nr:NADH-quinone oxidoreductase subunit J [Magnetococcales bacterium]MBF0115107.1 NADH-quinone oxidoreductase subunit J [Magnetococcales bacterium]